MSILIRIFLSLAFLAYAFCDLKHALHAFQQNRYELFRYKNWQKEQKAGREEIVLFLLFNAVWFLFLLLPVFWPLVLCLMLAAAVVRFVLESRRTYIKPLVFTARVWRQIAVCAILLFGVSFLWLSLFPFRLYVLLLIGTGALCYYLIYPMFVLCEPIEKAVREHFINDARRILAASPDLIRIGITGSYGKTSTKNILQAVLSDSYYSLMTPASFNTPLGITITIRNDLKPLHEVFICEMGADKVGEIDYLTKFVKPSIGIVTSIGPQHLNTFGSLENIIQEKMLMAENLPEDGCAILNIDNPYIRDYQVKNRCRILTCGIENENADYRAVNIVYSPQGSRFDVVCEGKTLPFETKLLGKHNILNILVAIACGRVLNVPFEKLQKAVRNMEAVEHRLQLKTINGLRFIDNAFNSNPEGSAMSLEVLAMMEKTRWVITPGMIDLGPIQEEANYRFGTLMKDRADEVILVGRKQTEPIYRGLAESGFVMEHVRVVDSVKEAFAYVYENASASDTILLENDLPDAFSH